MSQMLPLGGFKRLSGLSDQVVSYKATLKIAIYNDFPFLPEKMKIEKVEKLVANLDDKKNMLYT